MTRHDYTYYDLIIAMDSYNVRNLHRMLGGDPEGKIHMMLDYTDRPGDVADPWYTDNFDATWKDCTDGCRGLLKSIVR